MPRGRATALYFGLPVPPPEAKSEGDYIQEAGQENAKLLVIEGASWVEIGALRGLWLYPTHRSKQVCAWK